MLQKLRERSQSEAGFTLVELLVVMLIIGLLAAIAIPSFFNQRDKAKDSSAKEAVRTAQTAMETYSTDNNGSYVGATGGTATDKLNVIEPTLNDVGTRLVVTGTGGTGVPAAKAYRVSVTASDTGNKFWIERATNGTLAYGCTTAASGGCPSTGTWN